MNPLQRTIKEVIVTDMDFIQLNKVYNACSRGIKLFQAVKYVTGKNTSQHTDYEITTGSHYGYDAVALKGKLGAIRFTLTPLFEVIE